MINDDGIHNVSLLGNLEIFAMKTAGIIGGIGPESTIEYYRQIVAAYRERTRDGSYPPVIINCIDMKKMLDLIGSNKLPAVTAYLLEELRRLGRAGADFGLLAANTPHVVYDALERQSPIPLISIVETTCQAAQTQRLKRIGLFGTSFTMEGRFYPDVFAPVGITLVLPAPNEQTYIHDKYMSELVRGILLPETRENLLGIVERMHAEEGIEAVILGGTELPLILRDTNHKGVLFLDTTKLHVERVVQLLLS